MRNLILALLFLALSGASICAFLLPAQGQDEATVVLDPANAAVGGALTTRLHFYGDGLAAATIDLAYDPAVLEPLSCAPGPEWDMAICNLAYAPGTIRVVLADALGLGGDVTLATFTFHVLAPSCVDVVPAVVTLANVDGQPITAQAQGAQFCGFGCGAFEFTGDGAINVSDVLAMLPCLNTETTEPRCP